MDLHPPLAGALTLSGAFGEARANHIHAGIDFRTGGRVGMPVHAAQEGFVSRVKVIGTGLGKTVYIDHPQGFTTVYAHLDGFIRPIDSLVKEHQHRHQRFEVDFTLGSRVLPVARGQLIGWSGNSGSSRGPHLHFETRITSSQKPINPAFSNLPITDTMAPVIRSVHLYRLGRIGAYHTINSRTELDVQSERNRYRAPDTLRAHGEIAFGVEAFDYVNRGSLRTGVNSMSMAVNGEVWYDFTINEFRFADTRYVNSHIDYALRVLTGQRVHRLLLEPNNRLDIYGTVTNRGAIALQPDSIYRVSIVVRDPFGNTCYFQAVVRGVRPPPAGQQPAPPPSDGLARIKMRYDKPNRLDTDLFALSIPSHALYNHLMFTHGDSDAPRGAFSRTIHVHNRLTPVHKAYTLAIAASALPAELRHKALLGTFTPEGRIVAAGGRYRRGAVEASLREFGDFFIVVDTIPPTIQPLNFRPGKNMGGERSMDFTVRDNLSGVARITGHINGQWVVFEHDPKNDRVTHIFDPRRLPRGQGHRLTLEVEDRMGNVSTFRGQFDW